MFSYPDSYSVYSHNRDQLVLIARLAIIWRTWFLLYAGEAGEEGDD